MELLKPENMTRQQLILEVQHHRRRLAEINELYSELDLPDEQLREMANDMFQENMSKMLDWEIKFTLSMLDTAPPYSNAQRYHLKKILHLYADPSKHGFQFGK